ncbi:stalk domain-containing protein [Gorillibacterium sp. CAU 1737]|uniref:stalk domain-containing protein n=1 Tax=Gorillibacterium sp. CAU 1737 TaxID=3140362 RepID=UPI00325FFF16
MNRRKSFCLLLLVLILLVGSLPTAPAPATAAGTTWRIAGDDHVTLALSSSGTLWAWGANNYNQLGRPGLREAPSPIQLMTQVKDISTLGTTTLTLKSDGTVWGWGNNFTGQLGTKPLIEKTETIAKPIKVNGLSSVKSIAAGISHSLALKSDGTVWAWGSNKDGELGIGSHGKDKNTWGPTVIEITPKQVKNLRNVVAIAAGLQYSAAIDKDGNLWTWGNCYPTYASSTIGQKSDVPKKVSGMTQVVQLSAQKDRLLVLRKDGTVWGIGDGSEGELGDGIKRTNDDNEVSTKFVQAKGLKNAIQISAGSDVSAAVTKDGSVWVWGDNEYGQLAADWKTGWSWEPVKVDGLTKVQSVYAADSHVYAQSTDGSVWGWGENFRQLLLNGKNEHINVPVQIPLPGYKKITPPAPKRVEELSFTIKGEPFDLGGPGVFLNEKGIAMIPLRFLEKLGASIIQVPSTQSAMFIAGNTLYSMTAGDSRLYKGDSTSYLTGQPVLLNKEFYLPVSFVESILSGTSTLKTEDGQKTVDFTLPSPLPSFALKGVDLWGKKIRTISLPKNAASYPYVLQGIPNEAYEKPLFAVYQSRLVTPAQFMSRENYDKKVIDIWLKRIQDCYALLLNVDYKKDNKNWATQLYKLQSQGVNESQVIKANQVYADWVKKNQIQLEGSIHPEPSLIYVTDGQVRVRSLVKFRIKSYKQNKDILYDERYNKYISEVQSFKKGVWYQGYVDIAISTATFGDYNGTYSMPSIFNSLFYSDIVLTDKGITKFTVVK